MKRYLKYGIVAVVLTLVFYIAASLIYSSAYEHRLASENRLYKALYPSMLARTALIRDAIAGMQHQDDRVHRDLFGNDAPYIRNLVPAGFNTGDNVPEQKIQSYIAAETDSMEDSVTVIENRLQGIFWKLAGAGALPPMLCPIENVSYTQFGATVGKKYNPLARAELEHGGVDILTNIGTEVLATADGVVTAVGHSFKTTGGVVEIQHAGGYVTRYMHLTDIKVKKNQKVAAGQVIASVGMTGATCFPHLHYEVEKDGVTVDPSDCFFASFSPEEYEKMLYMTRNTSQTFD